MINLFKYDELKKFLNCAKEFGEVTSFEQSKPQTNGIILRHDVDFEVNRAFQMAELEKECGVSSTFFFLTSCPTYNVNSSINRRMLRDMSNSGFEIGLHFDPTLYPTEDVSLLENYAIFESSIIENIIGRKVKCISLHNPSIHGRYPMFDNFINAYDVEYFQPENYMSDSRMTFRDKSPYEFIKKAEIEKLQILLHPIHYSADGKNYAHLMRECVHRFCDELHETVSVNSQYVIDLEGKILKEIL